MQGQTRFSNSKSAILWNTVTVNSLDDVLMTLETGLRNKQDFATQFRIPQTTTVAD